MKPEPVPTSMVCSACGLSWQRHKEKRGRVGLDECVRLLKADLAGSRPIVWNNSFGSGITLTSSAS